MFGNSRRRAWNISYGDFFWKQSSVGKAQSASLEPSTWGALQTRSPTVLRHSEYLCVVVGSRKMYCWLRSTLAFLRATPRRRGPPRATRRPSAHASTCHAHAFMYKQMASPSKPNTYHASGSKHIKQPRWFPRGCTPKSRAPRRSGQKQRRCQGLFATNMMYTLRASEYPFSIPI